MSQSIKQGFWATITVYSGVAIGYINTIIFFPKFFTLEELGLYRLIVSNAMILAPFAMMGFGPVIVKFFPYFADDRKRKTGLYTFAFAVPTVAFLLLTGILYVFYPVIRDFFGENGEKYLEYFHVTVILTFLIVIFSLLDRVSRIHLNIVLPNFLREIFMRIFSFIMALLVGVGVLEFSVAIYIVLFHYSIAIIVLTTFLVRQHDFRIKLSLIKIRKIWRKRILEFAGFSMLMGLSSVILLNIDQIFITKYLGLAANGIYTLVFYIAVIIEIPRRVVAEIIGPKLSIYFREKKMDDVRRMYKSVAIDQTLVAVVLLLGITMSLEDLFLLIPKGDELRTGFTVVIIIAFAKLTDMTFSVNAAIISFSRLFRYNVPLIGMFMVLNIVLNWLLIPKYGLNGAALASLISTFLFNLVKMIFIWYQFGIQPFSLKILVTYIVGALVFLIVNQLPFQSGTIIAIALRSLVITVLYFLPLYWLHVSPNLNYVVNHFLGIAKNKINKGS